MQFLRSQPDRLWNFVRDFSVRMVRMDQKSRLPHPNANAQTVFPLQAVADTCFSSTAPAPGITTLPEDAHHDLIEALSQVSLEEVGLPPHADAKVGEMEVIMGPSRVSYMHVLDRPGRFSIGLFLFRSGSLLRLHDHPRMSVYSRLLFGELKIRSFDWVREPATPGAPANARLAHTHTFTPGDIQALTPEHGNLHELHALTACAVLDVLIPGYVGGRQCTYYTEHGAPWVDADGHHLQALRVFDGRVEDVLSTRYMGYVPSLP